MARRPEAPARSYALRRRRRPVARGGARMTLPGLLAWNRRYALKSYVSGSMWLVPLFAVLMYAVLNRAIHWLG